VGNRPAVPLKVLWPARSRGRERGAPRLLVDVVRDLLTLEHTGGHEEA
jgi:hypothetical protein